MLNLTFSRSKSIQGKKVYIITVGGLQIGNITYSLLTIKKTIHVKTIKLLN